jgi:predicted RNase H-like HicB family nuclease
LDAVTLPGGIQLELEELVAAGLTPMEALVAATYTAARVLGADEEIGTIEIGKRADLVLLDAERERPMKYRVLIEQDENGFFTAEVPALPGCISQGETREEALANIREAIAGYLESLSEHGDPIPPSIHEEIVEV